MAPYRRLSTEERLMVVLKVKQGLSYRTLAKQMKINFITVSSIVRKYAYTKTVADMKLEGRPKKITKKEDRTLVRLSLSNRRLTSFDLKSKLQGNYNITLAARTIRKRLQDAGLRGCIAAKKPLLTDRHRKARLAFAHEHKDWTSNQWKSVLWSDESSF